MSQTFKYYIGILLLSAVSLAFIVAAYPALKDYFVPTFVWLLPVSLVFDIAALKLSSEGKIAPLLPMERAAGMVAAAVLHIILVSYFVK